MTYGIVWLLATFGYQFQVESLSQVQTALSLAMQQIVVDNDPQKSSEEGKAVDKQWVTWNKDATSKWKRGTNQCFGTETQKTSKDMKSTHEMWRTFLHSNTDLTWHSRDIIWNPWRTSYVWRTIASETQGLEASAAISVEQCGTQW